jgi:uncharacterized protein YndB with AHSA1/START domain
MVTAAKVGVTSYTTPSDREVVITRVVDAPRELVWKVWTQPAHVSQWMIGRPGWSMTACEMDLRPGGKWRYVWRSDEGAELTLQGSVREVLPPKRIVTTESWGPDWPETLNTMALTEAGGLTTITLTLLYVSKDVRDAALKTGMKEGMELTFANLDGLLRTLKARA